VSRINSKCKIQNAKIQKSEVWPAMRVVSGFAF
jgi:hypothetical protein